MADKNSTFLSAFRYSLPILCGYLSIGIPFGILAVKTGYPWWIAPLSSLLMFAGAGQFLIIGLFATHAPLSAILIAELVLNIRHIVYGFSLLGKFKESGKWGFFMIYELSDETYAVLTGLKVPEYFPKNLKGKFYAQICMLNQSYWFFGTLIGAIAGELIPYELKGIDFSLTALFAVIFVNQIKGLLEERKINKNDTN